jgi:TPR repeat protein
MRAKAIFAAMLLALAPLPSVAQDSNAWLQVWLPLAQQGNADAQYKLGVAYEVGLLGVPQDYAEAVRWYRAAAEQGDVSAQVKVGRMFAEGQELDVAASLLQEKRVVRGIEQDYTVLIGQMRKG